MLWADRSSRLQTGTQSRCKYHSVHLNIYHLIFNCIHDKRAVFRHPVLLNRFARCLSTVRLLIKSLSAISWLERSQAYMIQNLEFSLGYFIIRGFRFRFMLPAITHIIENIHQQLLGKVILTGGDSRIAAITFSIPEFLRTNPFTPTSTIL